MPGHDLLPGFHLGKPVNSSGGSANADGSGNARDGNVEETGVLPNPNSIETRRVQQELVERAIAGDAVRSGVPVHVSLRQNHSVRVSSADESRKDVRPRCDAFAEGFGDCDRRTVTRFWDLKSRKDRLDGSGSCP